ncbi:Na(+)-translocating NADH-quinone reductase subunit A [bacterium]|nr:Na(+)-translocating NADH-quinone reductase subunit A [bacterium]
MKRIAIKKGLDIPLAGAPRQEIGTAPACGSVALLGDDYIGLKPAITVSEGDRVQLGQELFRDKRHPDVVFTSPGAGTVLSINRGEKRRFQSIVIGLSGDDAVSFPPRAPAELKLLSRDRAVERLLVSGLWTALRTRPFGMIPAPDSQPRSIFVNAMDTNPLAPAVSLVLQDRIEDLGHGLMVLARLSGGPVHLCKGPDLALPGFDIPSLAVSEFSGPHPAGNTGTHIHFLDPAARDRTVWYISARDTAAIGRLFTHGTLDVERIISIAGPSVREPGLVRTRTGASLDDLLQDRLLPGTHRVISGSVLTGRTASGSEAYLGRFHQHVSVIPEFEGLGTFRWLSPGLHRFSLKNIYLSRLFAGKRVDFTTAANGGLRAIVPIESYEKVMPLDMLPTYLLRALAADDLDEAEKLGCLELEEEDLALCTFVCPSKIDHGANLRRNLTILEKEG